MVSRGWCRSLVWLGVVLPLSWGVAGCAAEQPLDLRYLPPQVAVSDGSRRCTTPAADGLCPPTPIANNDDDWRCPFPSAADRARIDDASVRLRINISATGSAEGVQILEDPGYGFGRIAAVCALLHAYLPAHYPDGRATGGALFMKIHFTR